jgi:hypothetical protein
MLALFAADPKAGIRTSEEFQIHLEGPNCVFFGRRTHFKGGSDLSKLALSGFLKHKTAQD